MQAIVTPDLCDAFPDQLRVFQPGLRHYGGRTNFHGQVVTICCFEDNSKIGDVLRSENGKDKVLVVDGGGSMRRALFGDMLAEAAVKNTWSGVIINGCLRDVEAIKNMPLGVLALNANPLKTLKRNLGDVNVPINIFGTIVNPGDYLYADETGVVVSDRPLITA